MLSQAQYESTCTSIAGCSFSLLLSIYWGVMNKLVRTDAAFLATGQSCLLGEIFTFGRPGGLPVVAPFEVLKETTSFFL